MYIVISQITLMFSFYHQSSVWRVSGCHLKAYVLYRDTYCIVI